MKTITTSIWNFLLEVGRARAAAALARSGNFSAARNLMK